MLEESSESSFSPLAGKLVVEFAGIGPGPFCGMLLGDLGARVIRIDRPGTSTGELSEATQASYRREVMGRSKWSIALDLKSDESAEIVKGLIARADVLLEGYRPGVMERLGYGPEEAFALNEALIYARMTGWGQSGPLANLAGHDLNYISVAGVLSMIGPKDGPPSIPLNLVGDFGGGGMYMAFAIAASLATPPSQRHRIVIDTAMCEGAATLASMIFGMRGAGGWVDQRESNLIDGGAPFYRIYRCSDGGYLGVAALEVQFYQELIGRLGVADEAAFSAQYRTETWPQMRSAFEAIFASKPRGYFEELLAGCDACSFPVYSPEEALAHPHNVARGAFVEMAGVTQPAPGPLFNGSRPTKPGLPPYPDEHRREVLDLLEAT